MHITRAQWITAAVVVAIGGGITYTMRPKPLAVDTAAVVRGTLETVIDADGRTRVRDRYVVTAPVAGRIARVSLAEGDRVREGEVVARLAPAPFDEPASRQARARLAAARAVADEGRTNVRMADAAFAQAKRDVERMRHLFAAGALSARAREEAELALEARRSELQSATARVAAADAEVRQASAGLLYAGGAGGVVAVRAPSAGRVLRLADRSERVLGPGSVIAEIGDTRAIEAVVDVLSSDAARVCEGMTVTLDGWGGEAPLRGRVRRVEPAAVTRISALGVEEQRVNVIVDVSDPPEQLGDGFRVDARIVVWESRDALTVPVSALVRSGPGWAAFTVDDGRARLRAIEIGQMGAARAEVASGLAEGDRVLVFPSDKVRDGVRITEP